MLQTAGLWYILRMEPRFTVAQFNDMINLTLQGVGDVVVEGEITQMNISTKGGVNIVLKDAKSQAILNISGYAPRVEGITLIKIGMQVACYGIPALWSQGGRFSLQIFKILPLGEGALKEAYEKLKAKLNAEGLFSVARKRPLPEVVTRIALLTGRDSAAQSDFLKILRENKAGFEVDYYPVQVQGKYSEKEIIGTLKYVDGLQYDCIVLVRGGGSLEDLITFNSEKLSRVIYAMQKPVVVGIGHEKDESIADFVADVRASTPSQAAYYLITNNRNYLLAQEQKTGFIKEQLQEKLQEAYYKFANKTRGISAGLRQRLNAVNFKLQQTAYATHNFKNQLIKISERVQGLARMLKTAGFPGKVANWQQKVISLTRLLQSYDPKGVLSRGYAIARTENGEVLKSVTQVEAGANISIMLNKGQLISKILQIKNES